MTLICGFQRLINSCEADLDVVFVVDGSGSIRDANPTDNSYDNWSLLLDFVSGIVQGLPFENGRIRFGLVLFSDEGRVVFSLGDYLYTGPDSERMLLGAVSEVPFPGANTNTSGGLLVARTQFSGTGGDRPDAQNVAIVITDGKSTYDNNKTLDSANKLREANTNVIVVGITNSVDEDELRGISSSPKMLGQNYFTSPDFQGLGGILNKLLTQACVTTPVPAPDCPGQADVVFIVDSSGSIQEDRFMTLKMWISDVVRRLDLETGRVRVGVLQFSDNPNLVFNLNRYRSRLEAQNAIENMRYIRGTTKTAEALRFAREQMFTDRNGDRSGVANIALVLTDGGSNDKDITIREAVNLKTSGTHVISMGIGSWTDEQELIAMASYPYDRNYIKVDSFNSLNQFTERLSAIICNRDNECRGRPCAFGTCVDSFDSYICECQPGYGGRNCDKRCNTPSDVIFALDSSGSIDKNNFQRTIDFTTNAILDLPIGAGARVGLLTFSNEARIYVHLRDHETKMALLNSLSIPYFTGGTTNTAAALRAMWQNMFVSQQGDRPDVPNVGVVITDGKSNEPEATWNEAMQARDRGIEMIAVGVGNSVRVSELEAIASFPTSNNVFVVDQFQNLQRESDNLFNSICNTNNECSSNPCLFGGRCIDLMNGYRCECARGFTGSTCERRCDGSADVAFLVDRSGSIRNERWSDVTNFLNSIIENLEVGPDRVQVAAATFSNDASLEFRLNQYKTKQDVMAAVSRMKYTGGRTNTAGGLEVIREQIFRADQGDRQNVPNYLIIITDGNSNIRREETLTQAIAARIEGIHIVTVAIGELLNMMELRGLASDPVSQNVLNVNSFRAIDTLKDPLIMSMCDDSNECQSNPCQGGGTCINGLKKYVCVCPRERSGENCERTCRRQYDLVFLLDFSGSVEESYNITIAFTRRVIYGLEFRFDRVRVGMATFANNTDVRFNLNTYTDKQDILNALSFPRTGGMTNTQDALRTANDRMLSRNAGERNGVQDVVVILTDGGSNVNAGNTIPAARQLKSRGALIYAISVGSMADLNEIQQIATSANAPYVLRIDTQDAVDRVAENLLDNLCQ